MEPSLTTFLEPLNEAGDSGYGGSECCNGRIDDNGELLTGKRNTTIENLTLNEKEDEPMQQLHQVTEQEQERHRRYMLQVFTPDHDGDTYLHIWAAQNMLKEMRIFIQYCPNRELLDIQNRHKQAAIHVATFLDLDDVVSLLIQRGANMHLVDVEGKNILHLCAETGHKRTLNAIIGTCKEMGIFESLSKLLNATNNSGCTPFFSAVLHRHKDICDIMVQSFGGLGLNVDAMDDKNGNSPLHEAVMMRDADLALFLLKYCKLNVNFQNKQGVTPLHIAAGEGDGAICAILLQYGALRDSQDSRGKIPAVYAANDRILEYLKV